MTDEEATQVQAPFSAPPTGIEVMETEEGEFSFLIRIPPEPSHVATAIWKCGLALLFLGATFWFPFSEYIASWFLVLPRLLMIALIVAFWVFFLVSEFLEVTIYTLGKEALVFKNKTLGFMYGENQISRMDAADVFEKRNDDPKYPCSVAIEVASQKDFFESIPLTEAQCKWLLPIIKSWLEDSSGLIHPDDEDHR